MESLETVKENRMASLEAVALDQERWTLTADRLKRGLEKARLRIFGLSIGAAILAALAAEMHTAYPVASEAAGYAAAVALALVVVVRAQGLSRQRVQAWVLAVAASRWLKSEMYQYRTSSGPYGDHFGGSPDATLLERRDDILEKVKAIQRYSVEPDPKMVTKLGPLDADAYISERVNGAINWFSRAAVHFVSAQGFWQKGEYILAIGGALLAATLTITHNLAYAAWVAVVTTASVVVGADNLAERYAEFGLTFRAMPARLTNILARWRANHGTLDQLVEQVEATLLEQSQAWVAGADEFWADATGAKQERLRLRRKTMLTPRSKLAR
jgi:conflict system pore-forming effector with SLATT domain/uncharacterized protein DUF4231